MILCAFLSTGVAELSTLAPFAAIPLNTKFSTPCKLSACMSLCYADLSFSLRLVDFRVRIVLLHIMSLLCVYLSELF